MGIVKAISGHTGARGVMRYLERDGRALVIPSTYFSPSAQTNRRRSR